MENTRPERVAGQLRELAADFVNKESNHLSLITVTAVTVSRDLKHATVLVTVLPEEQEDGAIHFLRRKRTEFREQVQKRMNLKHIPFFEFVLDTGEKHRQHIDVLLRQDQ